MSAEQFVSPCPAPDPYQRECAEILTEECAEIIIEASTIKNLPFNPENQRNLSFEVGDFLEILDHARRAGIVTEDSIADIRATVVIQPAPGDLTLTIINRAAHVQCRATKLLRFGVLEIQPGQPYTNAIRLSMAVGTLLKAIDIACHSRLILMPWVEQGQERKRGQLAKFMQHAP
jgi:hypothetical protein